MAAAAPSVCVYCSEGPNHRNGTLVWGPSHSIPNHHDRSKEVSHLAHRACLELQLKDRNRCNGCLKDKSVIIIPVDYLQMSQSKRGDLVNSAVHSRDFNKLKRLLRSGPISMETLVKVIKKCIDQLNKHPDYFKMLEELFSLSKELDQAHRGNVVLHAVSAAALNDRDDPARERSYKIVDELLKPYSDISDTDRSEAIAIALGLDDGQAVAERLRT